MLNKIKNWSFILIPLIIDSCSQGECNIPSNYNVTKSAGSFSSIFPLSLPPNLPSNYVFTNNLGISNLLTKDTLRIGYDERLYNTVTNTNDCGSYKVSYIETDPYQSINFIPSSQPNFPHQYTRTIYSVYQNYQNINSSIKLNTPYEILTTSFISSFADYTFLIPVGGVKTLLKNYNYSDSITLAGKQFKNVYHIYSDSSIYNANNIILWGIYYNLNDGIIGYYLTSGELWVRQ